MNCPCVCINYLLAHYRKNNFEATFQHLPSHVRTELKENPKFCQNLLHPVFNRESGERIINERKTKNNGRQGLYVKCPTTHEELSSPRSTELIRPRKTSYIKKGARFIGNGEVSGGNTTSPNRSHSRRDSERYTNCMTRMVAPRNLMSRSAVNMLEAVSEEPPSAQNSDFLGEASDQPQLLMNVPMIDNLLTQEMQQEMTNNNDDVENAESVREECDTSTTTSSEGHQLMNTQ